MSKIYKLSFWICLIFSILIIGVSLLCPPPGVVDSSVIMAVGELLLFPTLAFGAKALEEKNNIKITKGDTSIEIDGKE